MTVNEILVVNKIIRERINDLKTLRLEVSTKKTIFREATETKDPQYNVKKLDAKIVKLQNFLLKTEQIIKQSNAVTNVAVEIDLDDLLSPLE